MEQAKIVAQLVRQGHHDVGGHERHGAMLAVGIPVGLKIAAVRRPPGIHAVDRRAEYVAQLSLADIFPVHGLQALQRMVCLDGQGHVRQPQHLTVSAGFEMVHHHVNVLVGVPHVFRVRAIGHERLLVNGILARIAHVLHSRGRQRAPVLVTLGQHKPQSHVGALAIYATAINLVDILQQASQPWRGYILRGIVLVLVEHVEYHGQLVFVVVVHGALGLILILVRHAGRRRRAQAVVSSTRCHQQEQCRPDRR